MTHAPALWEVVSGTPDARLRGNVISYTGYVKLATAPMRRLEAPFAGIPMIVSFGQALLVDGVRHRSFVAGLGDRASVTEYTGEQRGLQVDFTPSGGSSRSRTCRAVRGSRTISQTSSKTRPPARRSFAAMTIYPQRARGRRPAPGRARRSGLAVRLA